MMNLSIGIADVVREVFHKDWGVEKRDKLDVYPTLIFFPRSAYRVLHDKRI
jgi:hypothetical protein